ncbi:MAG TPA: hypothetical protein DCQ08_02025 [Amoebophilaceae bacterium]|nr:hypothetical protein [Amoebophilaceae bacterium]
MPYSKKAMKKFTIILTVLLFAAVGNPVLAKKLQKTELQKQKAEIKAWKQRKAAMQPLQLKDLIEENHRLKTRNQKLIEEIKVTKEVLEELIEFKTQVEARRNGPGSPGEGNGETSSQAGESLYLAQGMIGPDGFGKDDWAVDNSGQFYIKGVVFKVQIGAYKKRDLSNVLEGKKLQEVFEQERSKGINMYTLRHFRDYQKANQFKKELRVMGLKDAWIVAFKDGKRVPLKDVLQKVIKNKKK